MSRDRVIVKFSNTIGTRGLRLLGWSHNPWRARNARYGGFDEYVEWLDRTPSVWVLEPLPEDAVAT
ncbi:MAG TPA: hypothetical protein VHU86_06800 [Solirubrobacterales bacterium]|nr:hypothetical protein [Solirubrobacterales bacterium]